MSILSAQRDRLRAIADNLFDMGCHNCASEVRDAADTIWQLSNDCVDLRMENEKLREYITAVANDVYGSRLFDCSWCRFFEQCCNDEPKEHDGRGCQWLLWARELGIEVGK